MIQFLQYPKCGTCRKAAKWLEANGVAVVSRDIVTDNPTEAELTRWIEKSGLPVSKFFNTSGVLYKEMNMKDKVKVTPESELIALLAQHGKLVKRPIVEAGDVVLVGFKEEEWKDALIK